MLGQRTHGNQTIAGSSGDPIPAAISDIGCEREINEDRYAVIESASGRAWIVCDGMGGVSGGDLAAQLAIDTIRRGLTSCDYSSPSEAMLNSVEEANRVIVLRRQNPPFSNMGTTIVAAIVKDNEVVVASAGDSRAYLIQDRALRQLTTDHTYVQDLVDSGALDPEEALSHPQAHVLTRCLGAEPRLELDVRHYWIWPNESSEQEEDRLLLCSDGLYSLVSEAEIGQMVSTFSPQESCVKLVELAKERGGFDNITLAILPLGGVLREECPPAIERSRAFPRIDGQTDAPFPWSTFPIGKRLGLMFSLVFLGSVFATVVALLKLIGE